MSLLLNKTPNLNVVLIFAGSENNKNSFTKKILQKIKKYKLTNRIIFCGNISDMPALYSLADIVLSTSIEPEAFGRISAEAGSMTKPVIASNHGGSREIIENNVSGWLVPPGLELSQQKKDLVGNNARKRVIEKFSLRKMLDKTIKVYEELIAAKENFSN